MATIVLRLMFVVLLGLKGLHTTTFPFIPSTQVYIFKPVPLGSACFDSCVLTVWEISNLTT